MTVNTYEKKTINIFKMSGLPHGKSTVQLLGKRHTQTWRHTDAQTVFYVSSTRTADEKRNDSSPSLSSSLDTLGQGDK